MSDFMTELKDQASTTWNHQADFVYRFVTSGDEKILAKLSPTQRSWQMHWQRSVAEKMNPPPQLSAETLLRLRVSPGGRSLTENSSHLPAGFQTRTTTLFACDRGHWREMKCGILPLYTRIAEATPRSARRRTTTR